MSEFNRLDDVQTSKEKWIEVGKKLLTILNLIVSLTVVIVISTVVPGLQKDTESLQLSNKYLMMEYPLIYNQISMLINQTGKATGSIDVIVSFLTSIGDIQAKIKQIEVSQNNTIIEINDINTKTLDLLNQVTKTKVLVESSQMLLNNSQNQLLMALNQTSFLSGQISYIYNLISQLNSIQENLNNVNQMISMVNDTADDLNIEVNKIKQFLNYSGCTNCGFFIGGSGTFGPGSYLINNVSFNLCGFLLINGTSVLQMDDIYSMSVTLTLGLLGSNLTVFTSNSVGVITSEMYLKNMTFSQCYYSSQLYVDILCNPHCGSIQIKESYYDLIVSR